MDTPLTLPAPAKLNLFLHINGRREDGYHELQTAFQLLDFGDELSFQLTNEESISITPDDLGISLTDNLIYRAAKLLEPYRNVKKGAHIHLTKHLPMGGGVGGGSSDAATTLIALNKLWECQLSNEKLCALGVQLGADVPVFVNGKTALANGIGEELSPLETEPFWFVVLCPDTHVSTAQIFSSELLTRDTPKMKIAPALGGEALWALRNDCEALVTSLYPEIEAAIKWLEPFGPTRLTGTGACCFCAVDSEVKARQVLNKASPDFKGFVAKGVSLSPAIERLNKAERFATNSSQ